MRGHGTDPPSVSWNPGSIETEIDREPYAYCNRFNCWAFTLAAGAGPGPAMKRFRPRVDSLLIASGQS